MNDTPRFGTAGLADSYTVKKFDPAAIAAYTAGFGLTAFEYQCGRGVRLAHDKAAALGAACAERDIALSVHAPYYISMSSLEEDKRLHSIDYLLQSCALVKALGGRRVIFHSGSCGKQSREEALEKALDTMARAVKACDEAGFEDCILCPETMGKVNQLGTLDEVLALCEVDPRITPCIDFGTCTPAAAACSLPTPPPPRTTPPCWTRWPRGWGMTAPCISTRIFPALPTPRAARSAI